MALKIYPLVLNESNYVVWAPDMETLLKIKGLWQYTKVEIIDPTNDQVKFVVDGKKMRLQESLRPTSNERLIFTSVESIVLIKSRRS
jgi:hypothetical protein